MASTDSKRHASESKITEETLSAPHDWDPLTLKCVDCEAELSRVTETGAWRCDPTQSEFNLAIEAATRMFKQEN